MTARACFQCGKPAPYGFRLPGPRASLPAGRRGYLWSCADHRDEAEARWQAAKSPLIRSAADAEG